MSENLTEKGKCAKLGMSVNNFPMLPGLTEKESLVYESLLRLGVSSVLSIAETSGLKRPTVYLQIDELKKKGLILQVPRGTKVYYKAVDPARLQELAEQQVQVVKEVMPRLRHLAERQTGRPKVSMLEGKAGIDAIYKEIMDAKEVFFWASLGDVSSVVENSFREVGYASAKKGIRVREIINDSAADKKSAEQFALWAKENYSARIAPDAGIQNDNVIFGNVLAIFRMQANNLFVIRIEDPSIAETYKAIFELTWQASKPFIN
jgi:sugar-specific transcriptional regulator TrmB